MSQRERKPSGRPTPLRTMRRQRTLSQGELSVLLDVSQQTYAQWEIGTLIPPPELQVKIAAVLGTTLDVLWPDRRPRMDRSVAAGTIDRTDLRPEIG